MKVDPFELPETSPAGAPRPAPPNYVLGIMEAPRGTFALGLDGPDADAAYDALKAHGHAWPLHATWTHRPHAEAARAVVREHLRRVGFPSP